MTGRLPDEDEVKRRLHDALRSAIPRARTAVAYDEKARANDYFEAFLLATLPQDRAEFGWQVSLEDPGRREASRAAPERAQEALPSKAALHARRAEPSWRLSPWRHTLAWASPAPARWSTKLICLLLPQATAEAWPGRWWWRPIRASSPSRRGEVHLGSSSAARLRSRLTRARQGSVWLDGRRSGHHPR
jgi:hypothetical protein